MHFTFISCIVLRTTRRIIDLAILSIRITYGVFTVYSSELLYEDKVCIRAGMMRVRSGPPMHTLRYVVQS